jgi:hypothetical protein
MELPGVTRFTKIKGRGARFRYSGYVVSHGQLSSMVLQKHTAPSRVLSSLHFGTKWLVIAQTMQKENVLFAANVIQHTFASIT